MIRTDLSQDGSSVTISAIRNVVALEFANIDYSAAYIRRIKSIPEAFNLYRALGEALDEIQPGLCSATYDDKEAFAADKIRWSADQMRKGYGR
jgi:hypothetical protein